MNTNPTSSAGAAAPTPENKPAPVVSEGDLERVLCWVAIVNFMLATITACFAPQVSLACSAVAFIAFYVIKNG